MKSFNRLFWTVVLVTVSIFLGANLYISVQDRTVGRPYRVEAERAAREILRGGTENVDLSEYPSIIEIEVLSDINSDNFFDGNNDYIIKEIDGKLYRFDYCVNSNGQLAGTRLILNLSLTAVTVTALAVLLFIRIKLVKPFDRLKEVPYELSKGNLTMPLTENRHRFFGRFIWGMDMLRETLEQHKTNELRLQSEKKKLILSISHDIKIPLSAIKLYSKAISKNLYNSEERQREIAEKINEKADEIEGFVSQIVKASSEEFLQLSVENGEFYMSDLIKRVSEYYCEKLGFLKTEFSIFKYSDCMLKGDMERAVEVLQNVMENAIKYGDGRKIQLSFADEEDCRLITISNSGCTLSQGELPHIFDSFWRGSNVGTNGGSGLGLYICRELMHKMGGEIFARCVEGNMQVTAVFCKAG